MTNSILSLLYFFKTLLFYSIYKQFGVLVLIAFPILIFAQPEINPNGFNQFFYEDGTVSSEGYFKNGKPDGYWKTFFPSGELKSEGFRKNTLLDSIWNFYSEEGILLKQINYEKDKFEGTTKIFNKEGFLVKEENYHIGKKEGYTFTFYKNGSLKSKTPYLEGKKEGYAFEYDKDGKVVRVSRYEKDFIRSTEVINQKDKKGLKQGLWKEFFEDSDQVKWEGTYLNDLKNGYFREYSKSGVLLSTTKFQLGEVVENAEELENLEVIATYHSNGQIASVASYRDGVLEGVSKYYDEVGTITQSKIYRNGKLLGEGIVDEKGIKQGFWKEYFLASGKLRAEGEYKDGARFGPWTFYYETGEIEQKGKYVEGGLVNGNWKWYYKSGKILREEDFRRGREDGFLYEYDVKGNLITEGQFIGGYEEGIWKKSYGDYREEGEYIGGLKQGIWKHHYIPADILAFEGEYVNGMPEGKHTYYYEDGRRKLQGKYVGGQKEKIWTRYNPDGSVMLKIFYEDGKEKKLDGVTIKPKSE